MACSDISATTPEPPSGPPGGVADELATVAMRAQAFTGATGAAIALTEGSEIVCRASSGATSPEVGVHLSMERSFTGLAITSGKALRCDDTETDARVDAGVCREMRVRSMCAAPVRHRAAVVGVVAVFSSASNAFTDYHLAVLKTMADVIGQLLARSRAPGESEPPRPDAPPAVPAVPAFPRAASAAPPARAAAPVLRPSLPRGVSKPAVGVSAPAPAAVGKTEKPKPTPALVTKPPAVVPSLGAEHGSIFAADRDRDAGSAGRRLVFGVAAAAAVIVLGVVAWLVVGLPKPSQGIASAAQPSLVAVPVNPPGTSEPAPQTAAPATAPQEVQPVDSAKRPSLPKPAPSIQDPQETVAAPAPAPVVVAGGSLSARRGEAEVAPPSLMPAASSSLPVLSASAPVVPTLRVVTVPPRLLSRTKPVFPESAKLMHLHGTVVLDVTVDPHGAVAEVRQVSGNKFFFPSAVAAIRQWKYAPQTVNGKPVDAIVRVVINFELPRP